MSIPSLPWIHYLSRANHSHFNLNAEENDFAGLDFAALDRLAGYEEEEDACGADVARENSPLAAGQGANQTPRERRVSSRSPQTRASSVPPAQSGSMPSEEANVL